MLRNRWKTYQSGGADEGDVLEKIIITNTVLVCAMRAVRQCRAYETWYPSNVSVVVGGSIARETYS